MTTSPSFDRAKKPRPPLNETKLRDLALHYVGRFATTRSKLIAYLNRKINERGWDGPQPPDPVELAGRLAELGYIDDAGFAAMKGAALTRRGFGTRRVGEALRAAGVDETDRAPAMDDAASAKWAAADAFARRKRLGPYAAAPVEREKRDKQIAAFLRAGHDYAMARIWIDAAPGEIPEREE
ncbi:RecX family transcriptional regulator [Sphingobium sp. SCG-1]|uniref:regulatory protein RecX n=1 Tax=Sphingobium sp. SCG-1 TaxID=2072936 RepID=UPI000CD6C2F9|nr:RecX family transcriptional regulator [Sphingobium sp. SCG-1]AUW60157.1 RecX family transcriptional regulator [Sphingobium sp. SCG-1]